MPGLHGHEFQHCIARGRGRGKTDPKIRSRGRVTKFDDVLERRPEFLLRLRRTVHWMHEHWADGSLYLCINQKGEGQASVITRYQWSKMRTLDEKAVPLGHMYMLE